MRNERRKQVFLLIVLIITILSVTIGFAAFSATLRINTTVIVTPSQDSFVVKFSTTNSSVATKGEISPTLYPSMETSNSSKDISATTVTVDGSTNLKGLSASFVSPGDFAIYKVYAVNEGMYDAYLNSVNFLGSKTCIAGDGANYDLVQEACNGISVTVSIAGTHYDSTTQITNHKLSKGTGEEILVTIAYSESAKRADGPFTVRFGGVSLLYSTTDNPAEVPTLPDESETPKICLLTDNDLNGDATTNDEITCTKGDVSESFYVIDNKNGVINMLSKYNLVLSETEPIQDISKAINGTHFSSSIYWYDSLNSSYMVDSSYAINGRTYPYIFGNYPDNNVYQYVQLYKNKLEQMGLYVINAKLMSYEQAVNLGCSDTSCSAAPFWVKSLSYWTGSSNLSNDIWYINNNGQFGTLPYNNDSVGIRPVITILEDDLA